jgi:hypothetical protein
MSLIFHLLCLCVDPVFYLFLISFRYAVLCNLLNMEMESFNYFYIFLKGNLGVFFLYYLNHSFVWWQKEWLVIRKHI